MANLVPLADRIVVLPDELEKKTPGGIIIPDSTKGDKPKIGTVVAVGPGKVDAGERIKPEVKVNDRVLFGKIGGVDFQSGTTKYLIMKESDILAVIKE